MQLQDKVRFGAMALGAFAVSLAGLHVSPLHALNVLCSDVYIIDYYGN